MIADFGQARGTNTATILPNEARHARRYGRVILLRRNVMTAGAILGAQDAAFRAATVPAHHGDLVGRRRVPAHAGTRSATTSASTARRTAAASTRRCRALPTCSRR